jgi:hypothetical protein
LTRKQARIQKPFTNVIQTLHLISAFHMYLTFLQLQRDLREFYRGDFSLANQLLGRFEGHMVTDDDWFIADVKTKKSDVSGVKKEEAGQKGV